MAPRIEIVKAFVAGFLLSLSLCLDLGIVNVAILNTGIQLGARPAFLVGIGSCFGDLAYAVIALTALSALLESFVVRYLLWLGGTVLLLLLGARMLRGVLRPSQIAFATSPVIGARHFLRGMGLALASPSSILWFAAVGGSLIAAHGKDHAAVLPFLSGFFCAGIVWSLSLALLGGVTRAAFPDRALRFLALAAALLFGYLAVHVFVTGYRDLVATEVQPL